MYGEQETREYEVEVEMGKDEGGWSLDGTYLSEEAGAWLDSLGLHPDDAALIVSGTVVQDYYPGSWDEPEAYEIEIDDADATVSGHRIPDHLMDEFDSVIERIHEEEAQRGAD